jgi:hypothetical protein
MKLRVVVIGTGEEGDPFRAPLPTWTLVDIDYDARVAIIDVPDDVYSRPQRFETIVVTDKKGKQHNILIPHNNDLRVWETVEEDKYPQFARDRRLRDVIIRGA